MNEDENFESLIINLQKKIDSEEEKIYSKKVIKEYRNPSNFGFIKNPDASGMIKGSCGDTMRIDLKIKDEKILKAFFWTDGCGASIACGSIITKMITGKKLQDANNFTNEDVLKALNGLPIEHHHCSTLVIQTLQKAINNYIENKK